MTSADTERLACRTSCEAVKCQLRSFRTHLRLEEAFILGMYGNKKMSKRMAVISSSILKETYGDRDCQQVGRSQFQEEP